MSVPNTEWSEDFFQQIRNNTPSNIPATTNVKVSNTEHKEILSLDDFILGMRRRMEVSYCKYGAVAIAYPHKVNALESLLLRIDKYLESRNSEFLMDVANFAMIEAMCPSLDGVEFEQLNDTILGDVSVDEFATSEKYVRWLIEKYIKQYAQSRNTYYLVLIAVFCAVEFFNPAVVGTYFKGTDSDASPGRTTRTGLKGTSLSNDEI
jgi:hypothetical protein